MAKQSQFHTEFPSDRPLKIYAFDPTRGRELGNFMTVRVPFERDLQPGPVGRYLAVIDYDGSNRKYYAPVDLNEAAILARGGLDPSESDPRFHQQMVYAVASETIRRFENALGRTIRWRPDFGRKADPYHGKLLIFPHAMQEANAFYDPKMGALLFGYFPAADGDAGACLPGQTVFTCLSHDIVAHETTHALVDGLRKHFNEPTSSDTSAFHEAFADIVALFQHFSCEDALLHTVRRSGGLIHLAKLAPDSRPGIAGPMLQAELTPDNPMVELAKQFGEAMGNRAALRSALGTPPNTSDLDTAFEPHARGAVLVAAIFDAFFSIYIRRTRDLMHIVQRCGALSGPIDLHPELASRLAQEAAKTAEHFERICIRALDYCPPIDIQFGDFLRALITSDSDLAPEDTFGYRTALIEAFRSRGIRPDGAASYSEEALYWPGTGHERRAPRFEGIWEIVGRYESSRAADSLRTRGAAIAIQQAALRFRRPLGLSGRRTVQAQTFRRIRRAGLDGQLRFEIVVELMQIRKQKVLIDPADPGLGTFTMRGGTTVILNQDGGVRYAIPKSVDSQERLTRQRAYYQRLAGSSALAPYVPFHLESALSFGAMHRGY
ncbi:MAG: peptidase M4, partial [Bryobacteraceae bacterium]